MLSAHSKSLHRITWGMTAIALVTVAGLALTASGGRAAQQVAGMSASMSEGVGSARFAKLASFMPQASEKAEVAPAPEPAELAAPAVPAAPAAPTLRHGFAHDHAVPPAPPAPLMTAVPPVPPLPPEAGWERGIPTADQINAMIPRIDVEQHCDGAGPVTTETSVAANGKAQRVRIMICERDVALRARRTALHSLQQARAGVAAAQMGRDRAMSESIRAQVLADLDKEIARLRSHED